MSDTDQVSLILAHYAPQPRARKSRTQSPDWSPPADTPSRTATRRHHFLAASPARWPGRASPSITTRHDPLHQPGEMCSQLGTDRSSTCGGTCQIMNAALDGVLHPFEDALAQPGPGGAQLVTGRCEQEPGAGR
jgi:hypothetical protein